MCGRFTLEEAPETLSQLFSLETVAPLEPRYNIAPTQPIAALRCDPETGHRELTFLHWGLLPFWAKDRKIASRMINARSESVQDKPAFRAAFRYRRCLIPASGYYEWQAAEKKSPKQPFYFRRKDRRPLVFAGLWEHWEKDGAALESCTILTREAQGELKEIHHRMPLLLPSELWTSWLDPELQSKEEVVSLLQPASADLLEAYPVERLVNNVQNDAPQLIEPAESTG